MSLQYVKRYAIYQISPDGLIKNPKDAWRLEESGLYETEDEAFKRVKDQDYGACIIVAVATEVWVRE